MKNAMIIIPTDDQFDPEVSKQTFSSAYHTLKERGYNILSPKLVPPDKLESVKSLEMIISSYYLRTMAYCDLIYFCAGWEASAIASLVHMLAEAFQSTSNLEIEEESE